MGRKAGYSKQDYNYQRDSYIEGNAVRKQYRSSALSAPRRVEEAAVVPKPQVSRNVRRNREKARGISVGYVFFLLVMAVATLFVCVRFLQLQAESTAYRKSITSLESQLSALRMENDTAYEDTVASVDLAKVKDIAINELGMVYANEGQVILYDSQDSDYVRQYEDVPTE